MRKLRTQLSNVRTRTSSNHTDAVHRLRRFPYELSKLIIRRRVLSWLSRLLQELSASPLQQAALFLAVVGAASYFGQIVRWLGDNKVSIIAGIIIWAGLWFAVQRLRIWATRRETPEGQYHRFLELVQVHLRTVHNRDDRASILFGVQREFSGIGASTLIDQFERGRRDGYLIPVGSGDEFTIVGPLPTDPGYDAKS